MSMRRYESPNHIRFLTFSCYKRMQLLGSATIRDEFVSHLDRARHLHRFHLIAWVVMPEHVHLLIWPKLPESPTPKILRSLKQGFAQTVIHRWRENKAPILDRIVDPTGRMRFWQRGGGYDSNIYSDEELQQKLDYIHTNPVARGLAQHPTDWAWSSARWHEGLQEGLQEGTLAIDSPEKPS